MLNVSYLSQKDLLLLVGGRHGVVPDRRENTRGNCEVPWVRGLLATFGVIWQPYQNIYLYRLDYMML